MITFEEYKAHWGMFIKTYTPELLEHCKRNYERYIKYLESQEYFEPVDLNEELDDYKRRLYDILGFGNLEENEFHCLINASFKPESLLTISKKSNGFGLRYSSLVKSYWEQYYLKESNPSIDIIVSELTFSEDVGEKISTLLLNTIRDSKKMESGYIIIDGTVYLLMIKRSGKKICVKKHSPEEESRSGKIISLLRDLIDATVSGSLDVEKINAKIDALL